MDYIQLYWINIVFFYNVQYNRRKDIMVHNQLKPWWIAIRYRWGKNVWHTQCWQADRAGMVSKRFTHGIENWGMVYYCIRSNIPKFIFLSLEHGDGNIHGIFSRKSGHGLPVQVRDTANKYTNTMGDQLLLRQTTSWRLNKN